MKKLLAVACFGAFLASFAEAQTINFDDLKRPGKAVEKSWALSGVPTEAQGYIGKFGGADDIRVAQHRASQAAASAYASSSSSSSSNGSNTKQSPASAPKSSNPSSSNSVVAFSYKVISTRFYAGSTDEIKIQCSNKGYENTIYKKDGKYCDGVGYTSYCVSSIDNVAEYKCTGTMR